MKNKELKLVTGDNQCGVCLNSSQGLSVGLVKMNFGSNEPKLKRDNTLALSSKIGARGVL